MNIKEEVNKDFKEAFKSGDAVAKSVLSMLRSEIKNREIDNKGEELSDDQILDLIMSEIKKRKDSQKQYMDAGREELAESEKAEIDILMKYMPKQLSSDELSEIIDNAISEIGASGISDLGKVMSAIKEKVKGRADGAEVADMVKSKLS